MPTLWRHNRQNGQVVEISITTKDDGDFHIDADHPGLSLRRTGVFDSLWNVVRQVHGNEVVRAPTQEVEADGLTTEHENVVIAVQGADCAPLAFVTNNGPVGVVHAGWRGLQRGIVRSVVRSLQEQGAEIDHVIVGPTICSDCYEFGTEELRELATLFGESIVSTSATGTPSLSMPEMIRSALLLEGLDDIRNVATCTSCKDGGFSHRARQDPERHAMAMRITR